MGEEKIVTEEVVTEKSVIGKNVIGKTLTTDDFRKMEQSASEATTLLKSMANETRLMILCHLNGTELTVSQLLEKINLSQSALSQHLAILRREKLVKTRRDAQNVYYSLQSNEVQAVIKVLYQLYCEC